MNPAPWYLYLATPLRRHLLVGWYRIVARVDDRLFDRRPLYPEADEGGLGPGDGLDTSMTRTGQTRLRNVIVPRRSGELYLYVNDAVLFVPAVLRSIYSNNGGSATVIVTNQ